jgi:hypothetical protein
MDVVTTASIEIPDAVRTFENSTTSPSALPMSFPELPDIRDFVVNEKVALAASTIRLAFAAEEEVTSPPTTIAGNKVASIDTEIKPDNLRCNFFANPVANIIGTPKQSQAG